VYRAGFPPKAPGHAAVMSELMEPEGTESEPEEGELMEPQEEKGYGEDEGEREESLPSE
jgi:hypothetical protein